MLPLINKRWAGALRAPSRAWRVVEFGSANQRGQALDEAAKLQNATTALAWFRTRLG